jgi:hypothetical protein
MPVPRTITWVSGIVHDPIIIPSLRRAVAPDGVNFKGTPAEYNAGFDLAIARRPALAARERHPREVHANQGGPVRMMVCKRCDDSGWVCEEHPGRPWAGPHACIVAQRECLVHSATSPKMARSRECLKVSRPASIRAGAISDGSAEFEDPIELPNGRKLLTLRDAATYITRLPKAEHITPGWQAAMEALILVAENFGPTMLPCLVALKALNRHRLECSIGDCCPWVKLSCQS